MTWHDLPGHQCEVCSSGDPIVRGTAWLDWTKRVVRAAEYLLAGRNAGLFDDQQALAAARRYVEER